MDYGTSCAIKYNPTKHHDSLKGSFALRLNNTDTAYCHYKDFKEHFERNFKVLVTV